MLRRRLLRRRLGSLPFAHHKFQLIDPAVQLIDDLAQVGVQVSRSDIEM
jgi:hypothetical protein